MSKSIHLIVNINANLPGLLSHRRRIEDEIVPGPSDSPLCLSPVPKLKMSYVNKF